MIFMKAHITLIEMCLDNMAQLTHAISFHISLPPHLPAGVFGNITWPALHKYAENICIFMIHACICLPLPTNYSAP